MPEKLSTYELGIHGLQVEKIALIALIAVRWVISIAIGLELFDLFNVVELLESGGGTLCHHDATRCFSDSEGPWSVCARCSGMYFGWLLAVLTGACLRSSASCLLVFRVTTGLFALAVVAALLEWFGLFATSNNVRLCLGLPLGIFFGMMAVTANEHLKMSIAHNQTTP